MFTKINKLLIPNHEIRKFCCEAKKSKAKYSSGKQNILGQPTYETHPHILNVGEVTPLITKSEYQNRRVSLAESILKKEKSKNHLIVIPAASKQYMSDKIPYVFRQNTDFLYLTGCQEPDCCLIVNIGDSGNYCTTLFTRDKDEHAELWDGPRTHPESATDFFGVDQSLPISELENFLFSYKKTHQNSKLWYDFMTPIQKNTHSIICNLLNDTNNKGWENPKSLIHRLRLFKSPSEVALMQKSCDIASEAFVNTIARSKPGINESQIFAKVDYECRFNGAQFLAYPPVVAGGDRATIIHYINNNQIIQDNEMVLMDAGCEYHGYASDITRSWPINGKFTSQQREIYEIVHYVQQELIQLCNKFPSLDSLFESMCYLLGKKLQEIKLIGIQPSDNYLMKAAYNLCPHHVSHYLGMDIHDTPLINRNIKIEPGMVITVEPGIYISSRNKSLPAEYRGIGIRIEDDVLITEDGPVVLSKNCPKNLEEIEALSSQNQ